MARFSTKSMVSAIASLVLLLSGAGAKNYIDTHSKQVSVDDVIKLVDSKGYNHAGILHVSGSLKNISDIDNVKVTMTVSFLDGSKNPLKSVKSVREDLDAGEIWSFDVASLAKNAEYYSIEDISIEWK